MELSERSRVACAIIGITLIDISVFSIVLSLPVKLEISVIFFLWSNFLAYGHIIFTGVAFLRFKWKFNSRLIQPKVAALLGSSFLAISLIGWFTQIDVNFLNFRSLSIWSSLFLLMLYLYNRTKLSDFWVVYLAFLTVFVATEMWEFPLFIRFHFFSNPYGYPNWLFRFGLLNSKLWSGLLLLTWITVNGWHPTKTFLLTLLLVLIFYPAIILSDLGWTAWWYRLLYFPLCATLTLDLRSVKQNDKG